MVSAHRTPDGDDRRTAREAAGRGLRVIIAGAGGAAHLPGMVAAVTPLPVIGVPVPLKHLDGHGLAAVDRADAGRRAGRDRRRSAARATPACSPCASSRRADPELRERMEDFQGDLHDQPRRPRASACAAGSGSAERLVPPGRGQLPFGRPGGIRLRRPASASREAMRRFTEDGASGPAQGAVVPARRRARSRRRARCGRRRCLRAATTAPSASGSRVDELLPLGEQQHHVGASGGLQGGRAVRELGVGPAGVVQRAGS